MPLLCRWRARHLFVFFLCCIALNKDGRADDADGYWDGRLWSVVPKSSFVAVDSTGNLVVGGANLTCLFSSFPDIVRWDGRHWSIIATNAVQLSAMEMRGTDLFAGGLFAGIDGVAATNIARWDGTNWFSLAGGPTDRVSTMAFNSNFVYAASNVSPANGGTVKVWQWDGTNWLTLGDGLSGPVQALLATNGVVYAAWSSTNSPAQAYVSVWDGNAWTPAGAFSNSVSGGASVNSLAWYGDALLAAGAFQVVDDTAATNVAVRINNTWIQAGDVAASGTAQRAAVFNTNLFLCGAFSLVRDGVTNSAAVLTLVSNRWEIFLGTIASTANCIALRGPDVFVTANIFNFPIYPLGNSTIVWQFDGSRWAPMQNGLNSLPYFYRMALVPKGIACGFISAGLLRAPLLWDGSRFLATSVKSDTNVGTLFVNHDLAAVDGVAYAHATLVLTNRQQTNVLARLTDLTWEQTTPPMPVAISALAGNGGRVYIAGRNDSTSPRVGAVYQWDGAAWTQLGGGFQGPGLSQSGYISSLALFNGRLFVAGSFTSVSGQPLSYLAAWDGVAWQPVGDGLDGPVSRLVAADRLYIVGTFTNAGSTAVNRVAAWDGRNWSPLGTGLPAGTPRCIAVSNDGLVAVGGLFNGVGNVAATNIVVWRRDHWTALDKGFYSTDHPPDDVLWRGHDLYVCGEFIGVNNQESPGFAIWHEPRPLVSVPAFADGALDVTVSGATPSRFVIEKSTELNAWSPLTTNALGCPGQHFQDAQISASPQNFYRLRSLP